MATIDLGKIKQVWRGTYNNSTAYAVDDLVEYTDSGITSSYICTTASTGTAPSSSGTAHGSWAYVAKGAASFTSPLTTRGYIFFRDASGDARFPKGTTGQVLTATANDFAWATPSGDCAKIASGNAGGDGVTMVTVDNIFTSDYEIYKIYTSWREDAWLKVQLLNASGTTLSANSYEFSGSYAKRNTANSSTDYTGYSQFGQDYFPMHYWNGSDTIPGYAELTIMRPTDSATKPVGYVTAFASDDTTYYSHTHGWAYKVATGLRGLKFLAESDDFHNSGVGEFRYAVYGFKG